MKKSSSIVVLTLLMMLLIILSTGCKSQSAVASTLPTTEFTETEKLTEAEETLQQDITIATTELVTSEVLSTEVESGEIENSEFYSENDPRGSLPIDTTVKTIVDTTTVIVQSSSTKETTVMSATVAETLPIVPKYTYTELDKYMYCQGSTNVRSNPSLDGDIIFVMGLNRRVYVNGRCNETGWYRISQEGQTFFISDVMLADTEYVEPTTTVTVISTPQTSSWYRYYAIGNCYPKEELEQYLYEQLCNRGIGWYYPYAVAQIYQESNWNPNSTNGKDHGICQFKGIYWESRCAAAGLPGADIWNPYHSLYVYVWYVNQTLAATNYDIGWMLSFYITGIPGMWDESYVNAVMNWYNNYLHE